MHIADGVITAPVIACASVAAVAGLGFGLRAMDAERIPQVAVLSATFFIASLIHITVGPSSVHLIFNGLIGVLLGLAAFPAMFVGLLLQSVLFGFGGVTVLGVNLFNIAVPGVLCGMAARRFIVRGTPSAAALAGGIAGAAAVGLTALLVALSLALSGGEFRVAAKITVLTHVPVLAIEGAVTAAAVLLIKRVRPDMLTANRLARSVSPVP